MKLRDLLLFAFVTTSSSLMSCSSSSHIGANGVPQIKDPSEKDILKAMKKAGTEDWGFHPVKKNDTLLFSREIALEKNRALKFYYSTNHKEVKAMTYDPEAARQGQASSIGLSKGPITADQYEPSNVQHLLKNAQEAAAEWKAKGMLTVSYPSPSDSYHSSKDKSGPVF